MRAHVSDRGGLSGGSGGSGRRRARATRSTAADKAATNLFSDIQLATRERACSGDRIAWAAIARDAGLEQADHPFRAVSGPTGDCASF